MLVVGKAHPDVEWGLLAHVILKGRLYMDVWRRWEEEEDSAGLVGAAGRALETYDIQRVHFSYHKNTNT